MDEDKIKVVNPVPGTEETGGALPEGAKGTADPKTTDPSSKDENLEFLLNIEMKDVVNRMINDRKAQVVSVKIRDIKLIELKRDDGSIYHKFVVNLRQSVRGMINKGTAEMPNWQPGFISQIWLFPNQVLRACVEGGLSERLLPHLQSNMAVETLLNMFMAGSLMMLVIEPVTAHQIYYSPFTGEERGEVKNTSFYFMPYIISLPTDGKEDLEKYAGNYLTEFATQSVKMDMMKKR